MNSNCARHEEHLSWTGYDKNVDQSAALLNGGLDGIVIAGDDDDVIVAEYENI